MRPDPERLPGAVPIRLLPELAAGLGWDGASRAAVTPFFLEKAAMMATSDSRIQVRRRPLGDAPRPPQPLRHRALAVGTTLSALTALALAGPLRVCDTGR